MQPKPPPQRSASPLASRRVAVPLLTALAFLLLHYLRQGGAGIAAKWDAGTITATDKIEPTELLPVFELPRAVYPRGDPPHLTPMDPATLVPRAHPSPIDVAHRRGYVHVGHVMYVVDSSGKVLFLQRSKDVVTCPGTWSILGEHATVGETARETVVRGIEEELGFVGLGFEESDAEFSGSWTAEFHPVRDRQETLRVSIQNVTELPLFYVRHYGPYNEGRVDRQLTYLWSVLFPKGHDEIPWKLDDEVANHKWMGLDEVAEWLSDDKQSGKKLFASTADDNDGPDQGDFCHDTIRSLYEAGLATML